jgi:hypothetical protein
VDRSAAIRHAEVSDLPSNDRCQPCPELRDRPVQAFAKAEVAAMAAVRHAAVGSFAAHSCAPERKRPRGLGWRELMQRVFAIDVLRCDKCGGRGRRRRSRRSPSGAWPGRCSSTSAFRATHRSPARLAPPGCVDVAPGFDDEPRRRTTTAPGRTWSRTRGPPRGGRASRDHVPRRGEPSDAAVRVSGITIAWAQPERGLGLRPRAHVLVANDRQGRTILPQAPHRRGDQTLPGRESAVQPLSRATRVRGPCRTL